MKRSNRLDLNSARWRKSSYSTNGGECIEIADGIPGMVPVRDSKTPEGAALFIPAPVWNTFVTAVKSAAFSRRGGR
ncbi:DUF397 domain-containing protein [Streptomyces lydicus]|uniref:DUF397 domain-containing protein n=1 Tax=Streptomyces lydicus TaxID=47763 RepID=UPI0036E0C98A